MYKEEEISSDYRDIKNKNKNKKQKTKKKVVLQR